MEQQLASHHKSLGVLFQAITQLTTERPSAIGFHYLEADEAKPEGNGTVKESRAAYGACIGGAASPKTRAGANALGQRVPPGKRDDDQNEDWQVKPVLPGTGSVTWGPPSALVALEAEFRLLPHKAAGSPPPRH